MWKTKTFFKKLKYRFLVESTKIENASFRYQTAISEANDKTNKIVTTKELSFASNYLFFWKFCFNLRTSYKEFICCNNNPNGHICNFCERWSFIWRRFSPVSILKEIRLAIIPPRFQIVHCLNHVFFVALITCKEINQVFPNITELVVFSIYSYILYSYTRGFSGKSTSKGVCLINICTYLTTSTATFTPCTLTKLKLLVNYYMSIINCIIIRR